MKAASASGSHSAVVKTDGSLWVWGTGATAGYDDFIATPVKVADNVVSASGQGEYTLALQKDGALYGWGDIGYKYATGTSSGIDYISLTPKLILSNVSMVSAGYYRALALTNDGRLWLWGVNVDGTINGGPAPVSILDMDSQPIWGDPPVPPLAGEWNDGTAVTKVSASNAVLALKANGSVWAWGLNEAGEVGDGTANDKTAPVKILDNAADIQTFGTISKALMRDGTVMVWGAAEDNSEEVLGDGAFVGGRLPIALTGNAASISKDCLVLKQDGSLWGWNRWEWTALNGPTPKLHKIEDNVTGAFIDSGDIKQADGSILDVSWGSEAGGQYKFSFEAQGSDIIYQAKGAGAILQIYRDGTLWAKPYSASCWKHVIFNQ